jgi:hypothetical protein
LVREIKSELKNPIGRRKACLVMWSICIFKKWMQTKNECNYS